MIEDPHIEKKIKIGNTVAPVWFYGNPTNVPILFIHGRFRGFSEYIGDLPPKYLSKTYYVCAFDLPGFGKSKDVQIASVDFVEEIINKFFHSQRVVLFGTSYGGIVAINLALKYPESVKALIIAASPLIFSFLNLIYLALYLPQFSKRFSFIKEFKVLNKRSLREIKIPSLLFYGTSDRLAPIFMGKRLSRILPFSKLVIVKNRTHGWFLHRIDETGIFKEINVFISTLPKN